MYCSIIIFQTNNWKWIGGYPTSVMYWNEHHPDLYNIRYDTENFKCGHISANCCNHPLRKIYGDTYNLMNLFDFDDESCKVYKWIKVSHSESGKHYKYHQIQAESNKNCSALLMVNLAYPILYSLDCTESITRYIICEQKTIN